jgi:excinuclease ABC subunit C
MQNVVKGGDVMNPKEKAKHLPSSPGVYLMKDSYGSIIYVGKSKNLKSRVSSYFQESSRHSNKVLKLVQHLKDFDIIQTDTEFEAFILECKLIKEIQPLYNRLMKNPQSYTYIMIKMNRSCHRIELANCMNEDDGNLYFGPYTSKSRTEKAIQGLKEMFKIDCNQYSSRKGPCLNYSLGLCIGMCFDASAQIQYNHIMNRIICLLEGSDTSILDEMSQKMDEEAGRFDFEAAAKIRDHIEALQSLLKREKVIQFTKADKNIIMLEPIGDSRVKLFLIRRNQILYNRIYEINQTNQEQVISDIKNHIFNHFTKSVHIAENISKEEIDEAQIVYRYLNSHAEDSLIILDHWLYFKESDEIEKAVRELIDSLMESYFK